MDSDKVLPTSPDLVSVDQTRVALLARYGTAPQRLEELVRRLPPAARSFRPPAGGWTMTDVVIHLADNEAVDFVRVRMAIAESVSLIQRYDEAKRARELDYAGDSVGEALMAFRGAALANPSVARSPS